MLGHYRIKMYVCGGEKDRPDGLGIPYLKSNCPRAAVTVTKDRAELVDCDYIGLSATAHGLKEAVEILHSTDIPVIVGGSGALWEGLQEYPFEHIVIGEGERALNAILRDDAGKVVRFENVANIDAIRFPDRGDLPGHAVPFLSARGCPWSCAFCSSRAHWGGVRYHSPEYFIADVACALGQYPQAKHAYVLDDLFIANVGRFFKIADLWLKAGYHKRLTLAGFIRSSIFTREIGLKMKEMGFVNARFGAESGSNRVLELLNKKATVEDHQRTIDICNSIGLPVTASYMYDIPGETAEEAQMTRDFRERNLENCKPDGWYKFKAFPGTAFYDGENPIEESMSFRPWG